MRISDLCEVAHRESRAKGWYDSGERNTGELIALMHSELSEMMEAYREPEMPVSKKIPDFSLAAEEAADLLIRLADFCGYKDIDLENAVSAKLAYNRGRAYRHGGKGF